MAGSKAAQALAGDVGQALGQQGALQRLRDAALALELLARGNRQRRAFGGGRQQAQVGVGERRARAGPDLQSACVVPST